MHKDRSTRALFIKVHQVAQTGFGEGTNDLVRHLSLISQLNASTTRPGRLTPQECLRSSPRLYPPSGPLGGLWVLLVCSSAKGIATEGDGSLRGCTDAQGS
jgi:hypothetical protein